jgi:hypothetical protein
LASFSVGDEQCRISGLIQYLGHPWDKAFLKLVGNELIRDKGDFQSGRWQKKEIRYWDWFLLCRPNLTGSEIFHVDLENYGTLHSNEKYDLVRID